MKPAVEELYGVANMTAEKLVEFQVHLSNGETEATTWSMADMDCIGDQPEIEINGITSNVQMRFKKEI